MPFKQEYNATGSSQKLDLYRGVYKFECWGASGGDEGSIKGASGSYVSGTITIDEYTSFYVYVGKKGTHGTSSSFNGGGRGSANGASGGGATDIRLIDNQELSGLKSRIMVASGGGGTSLYSEGCSGGSGGIINGEDGLKNGIKANVYSPTGGTQSSGGKKGYPTSTNSNFDAYPGTFGSGGAAATNKNYGSGGGGGYFGGGGGADAPSATSSGAGGSSYVSGYEGCLAISQSATSISSPVMLSHSIHYSGFRFRKIEVIEGNELQRNDDGHVTISFLYNDNCSFARKLNSNRFSLTALTFIFVNTK